MSSFGRNVFLKTLNNNAEPDSIPDPLTLNQLNVNQIGDNSNPCETIHVASTFLYRGDISYIDNTDVDNQREFMKLQTDGDLNLVNNINFYDFILNNPASKSKFSIGLDELDSSFEIKSLDPVSQTRLKIGDTGINEWTFMQLTLDTEPLGAGVLLNNGPLILNTGDITLNSGKFIGDGSLLQNLPYPAENQSLQNVCDISPITTTSITANSFIGDGSQLTNLPIQPDTSTLQDVTTRGSISTTNDISFTGTGKFTINQDEIDGSLIRIRGGTQDAKIRIGETTNDDGYINAQRAILIGRNAGSFGCGIDVLALGSGSGYDQAGNYSVNLGDDSGQSNAGVESVSIGRFAGEVFSGLNSVSLGSYSNKNTGGTSSVNNTICINATGVELNSANPSSFTVKPIRPSPDVTLENLQLYYDSVSGEIKSGAINSGSIGSLSQVLAVGNTGGNINLTGDLDCSAIRLVNSIDWAYTTPTSSLTTLGIPLTNLTNAYTATLPSSPVPHTGDVFTFENSTGAIINAGDVVQFDDDFTNVNGVKIYAASASQSNQNCMPIGVCVQNSNTGNSCFVCTKGFTTCKAIDGSYVKGQMLGCTPGGSAVSSQITTNNVGIIGVCMESKVITTPGSGILVWIKPDFKL